MRTRPLNLPALLARPLSFAVFVHALVCLLVLYAGVACAVVSVAVQWFSERQLVRLADHVFIWGVLLYFVVVSAGPEAHSRFRVPVMPFLALYAAVGMRALYARWGGLRCIPWTGGRSDV